MVKCWEIKKHMQHEHVWNEDDGPVAKQEKIE